MSERSLQHARSSRPIRSSGCIEDVSPPLSTGDPVAWAGRGSGDGSRIGGRVGFHHKTLSSFLAAFGDAGFVLRAVREFVPPGAILSWDLALLAEKLR